MIIYKNQITNDELEEKLIDQNVVVLDVRETEEYAHGHIPGSVLIPLGQLADRCDELNKEETIYVICQAGGRSNEACHILRTNGFAAVYNVIPGMGGWTGDIESDF